jgi:CRP-like cAMP-binding protein
LRRARPHSALPCPPPPLGRGHSPSHAPPPVRARPRSRPRRRHPWVTQGGVAPLPCLSAGDPAAAPGAAARPSQEEVDGAIRRADGAVTERVEAVFAERRYGRGEVLVAPGDAADTVFLITAGEVEIVAPPLPDGSGGLGPLITGGGAGGGGGAEGARGGGGGGGSAPCCDAACDGEAGVAELLDGGSGLVPAGRVLDGAASAGAAASVALLGEVLTAGACRGAGGGGGAAPPLAAAAEGAGGAWGDDDDARRRLAVKGPGDSLGLPSLLEGCGSEHKWRVFCRARDDVTVFAARVADLQQLAARHPEIETAVQQIATQQETDMAVAEAMRRLRIFNGCGAGPGSAALAGGAAAAARGG